MNKTRSLHLAVAQIHSGGPISETIDRAERQISAASAVGADLILFSECALHGYDYDMSPESVRAVAEPVEGPHCRKIHEFAKQHQISVLIGFFENDAGSIFNSMLIARPDGSLRAARKHVLTASELFAEITPGHREREVFEINGVRCALIICADGGIEGLSEDLQRQGVDYRLCPTGGGGKVADMLRTHELQSSEGRSRYENNRPRVFNITPILSENDCPFSGFASANALGPVGNQTCHQGHCMIVDNQRVMRAQIPGTIVLEHMQDQMVHARLDF
jgi:predicted amidohydrolase